MSANEIIEAAHRPVRRDELAHSRRKGWVAVPGFFSPAQIEAISNWTDEVLHMPEVPGRHMVYHEPSLLDPQRRITQRIEDFCSFHPAFDTLVRSGPLAKAVEQMLGGAACLFKDKINFKMAGGGGFEAHQDQQAGWSTYAPLFVTALVSIDRATAENGCLEIADRDRADTLIGEEWKPLTPGQMKDFKLVPVPTEPGDVIFFDSYVPHASKPNLSGAVRRILYLTYNRSDAGDHRAQYFADKRVSFPPDIERVPGKEYRFRV